jgi:hypothetical protein
MSSTGDVLTALALLIKISRPPKVATAFSMAASTDFSSLISHWIGKHLPPAASISLAAV